jgi:monothiol glutaredoxin
MAIKSLFLAGAFLALALRTDAFVSPRPAIAASGVTTDATSSSYSTRMYMSDDFLQETPDSTKERIQMLVEEHDVLLFMKGSKLFPQCGFSNTAVQILTAYGIDFKTVDVLADSNIRQGIKEFSQWPTIPQLYVAGEFVGGSDIMIELYQSGELGEMIEKANADKI